ncbi:MAG: sodium-translocating pyrophosphatase [Spirochaeta sp. LUC14_002_19_P3]|nr:MAG: sodium-translocating pyrophosphatase [Spirochaeta sp. LUC14_002_19_P3]
MSIEQLLILTLAGACIALGYAFIKFLWIYKQKVQDENLIRISGYVADGAMAFLHREYKVLVPFVLIVAALLAFGNKGAIRLQAAAFFFGAITSSAAGYIGMKAATAANSRTTQAAKDKGLNAALQAAFSGGCVMGLSVVGLGVLGLAILFYVLGSLIGFDIPALQTTVLPVITGFSLGASSIALFARVGGGIYTKAADVGADLVGKVEASIPEDDPRNPATIADNVGDNVGDVAGMGADLFESFVGSIVGSMILGLSTAPTNEMKLKLAVLPFLLAVIGIAASIIGVFFVRAKDGESPHKALNTGVFTAAVLSLGGMFFLLRYFIGADAINENGAGYLKLFLAALTGLLAGLVVGGITEHYTGEKGRPVKQIADSALTGSATTIISGLSIGMLSAFPTMLVIIAGILGSYFFAGLYGVAIAAVGMLVTLGIQLAVDAYGPIADNAGGLAEMAKFPGSTRKITDSLDAVGNTTAAIGKGFAIGSAALTALILFTSFKESSGIQTINLTDVDVLAGILLGCVVPFLFSSIAMNAVGKAANMMIQEVRRQFREFPGIMENTQEPDYKKCVDISTKSALREMILPGTIAIITPILVGFIGGPGMLLGLLTGVTGSGVVLAVFMSNSGGAWDNAKKVIEAGAHGGKGTDAHKASVVGDTVGDPLKDTAGPSLNILIKLISMVSLVITPMLKAFWA